MFGKKNSEKTEVSTKKEQEKKNKLVGRIKPQKGHTLFKVSKNTLEISKAEFEKGDAKFVKGESQSKTRKVLAEEGFFYISALNVKNCKKKIIQMLGITKEDLDKLEEEVKQSKLEV